LRILYLIDSLRAEGSQQSLLQIVRALSGLGYDPRVGSLHGTGDLVGDFEAAGVTVHAHEGSRSRFEMLRYADRLIESSKPDLVHTTLYDADVLGRLAARHQRTPVVSSLVNTSYGEEHRADPAVRAWKLGCAQGLDALTARLAVRMHAVSREVANTTARRLRYPASRIDVVPRGRDPDALGTRTTVRRSASRAGLGVADDETLIVAVARQEYQKGLDVLMAATAILVERVPRLRVIVAGRSGSHTDVLRRTVEDLRLGNHVQFLGARADIAEILTAADVFVMPSRREGFPGAVLEAMALEAPIVASAIPQISEAVADGVARLVPVESSVALADAVMRTLAEPETTSRQVAAGRARFLARFTTEVIAGEMVAFYERALGSRPAGRRHSAPHA